MKRGVLWLVIGIPAASILMSAFMIWIAVSNPDPGVVLDARPLSKTSFREQE